MAVKANVRTCVVRNIHYSSSRTRKVTALFWPPKFVVLTSTMSNADPRLPCFLSSFLFLWRLSVEFMNWSMLTVQRDSKIHDMLPPEKSRNCGSAAPNSLEESRLILGGGSNNNSRNHPTKLAFPPPITTNIFRVNLRYVLQLYCDSISRLETLFVFADDLCRMQNTDYCMELCLICEYSNYIVLSTTV